MMVYLSGGNVVQGSKSLWSIGGLLELFWSVVNFIVLFVRTLFSPGSSPGGGKYDTTYRQVGRADQGRRIGRIGRGGGGGSSSGPSPPPMGGG